MPSVTFDGRSFMLDGRRLWLVSGSVEYLRVPRASWADRLHAAKLAGLNCVQTSAVWSVHEPRPGHFEFGGDQDLRAFVQMVGAAGLSCVLRVGPYVGGDWDFGGLPPWLMRVPNMAYRTAHGPFLEACSRYLTAVAEQIRPLQVTAAGKGGPILLVQSESGWTCGDDKQGADYLGELSRYLREAGVTVPVINSNNLWQGVEGDIDGWVGSDQLLSTMRQLATVRKNQPRVVIDFESAPTPLRGRAAPEAAHPAAVQRRLAEVLAGAGQFNLRPFHAGTCAGFSAGRLGDAPGSFAAGHGDAGEPLSEAGSRGPSFNLVRRVCTFASRFGRVLANLDPEYRPIMSDPGAAGRGCSIVHCVGPQGGVAFVFADDPSRTGEGPRPVSAPLMLRDGRSITVNLSSQAVGWCLLGAQLAGRAVLDYCSLNAFAVVGRVFVCFGPAGTEGHLSINDSPLTVTVPEGDEPLVVEHESMAVVVCSEDLVDRTFATDAAVYVGVESVLADGSPVPAAGSPRWTRIDSAGHRTHGSAKPATRRSPGRPAIGEWRRASQDSHAAGGNARFASIPGPAELGELGSPSGYGWYRLTLKSGKGGRVHLAAPQSADRLHLFLDGEPAGLIGDGPGAAPDAAVTLRKGKHTLVVLADNMGRASTGTDVGEQKGLYGHLWAVQPLKAGKPSVRRGAPIDVLGVRSPVWDVGRGDATIPDRVAWTVTHRRRTPLFLTFDRLTARALLLVNETPVLLLGRATPRRVCLWPEVIGKGLATIELAFLPEAALTDQPVSALVAGAQFSEGVDNLTEDAEWAFARWEPPPAGDFKVPSRGAAPGPAWWKAPLTVPDPSAAIELDTAGLTKGQVYVNGRNLGRYFQATADGKAVPGPRRMVVPGPWLNAGEGNELLIFDEHGGHPDRCSLVASKEPILRA